MFGKSIAVIGPKISVEIGERGVVSEKSKTVAKLLNLNLKIMQNLNKFESCYPALGNVSAINAVKAVGAKDTSLSTQVLDFLFGNVDIDGSKTATGDSGFNFVLKEGI